MSVRLADWSARWDLEATLDFICSQAADRVTLQFPDDLLDSSSEVAAAVEQGCRHRGKPATQVCVLADTTFNSMSVDEVAAQHINADCIVHYGRASLAPVTMLPAYFVFPREPLDLSATVSSLLSAFKEAQGLSIGKQAVIVLPDQSYLWAMTDLQEGLQAQASEGVSDLQVIFAEAPTRVRWPTQQQCRNAPKAAGVSSTTEAAPQADDCQTSGAAQSKCNCICSPPSPKSTCAAAPCSSAAQASPDTTNGALGESNGKQPASEQRCVLEPSSSADEQKAWQHTGGGFAWNLPAGMSMEDCTLLWMGSEDAPQLQHLHLTYNRNAWMQLDPTSQHLTHGLPPPVSRLLRRRYFLTEKAKDAHIIGIVVGTLGDRGYLQAARHVHKLAQAAGKKTYRLLMGRPSPAKLANFPEVEVFVMVADAPGLVLDDSKDYYAPVITPWEALLAFDDDLEWTGEYRLGFQCLLDHAAEMGRERASDRDQQRQRAPRQSLLDGGLHGSGTGQDGSSDPDGGSTALAKRLDRSLQVSGAGGKQLSEVKSAADYLATRRTYTGLESPLTGAAPKTVEKAVLGRSGRAATYKQEPSQRPHEI